MPPMNGDEVYRLMVQHERELREQNAKALEQALKLQAHEYDRRLDQLNGEHQRALEDKAQYLQRIVFDQSQKDFAAWKEQYHNDHAALAERITQNREVLTAGQRGMRNALMIAVPGTAVVIDLLIRLLT
jgi:hypothetical protein